MKLCFSGTALKSKALNFSVGLTISSYVKWVRDAFNCKMGILICFLVQLDDKLWKHFENQRKKERKVKSVMPDSLPPHGLWPTRLLHPWIFQATSTGVGCHFLLQGIFQTQGSNPGLLHCRQTLYHLSHQGSPKLLNKSKSLSLFLGSAVSHYTFVH